eukprot:scaffold6120_cov109-Isochrysis_galbana.AAC.6
MVTGGGPRRAATSAVSCDTGCVWRTPPERGKAPGASASTAEVNTNEAIELSSVRASDGFCFCMDQELKNFAALVGHLFRGQGQGWRTLHTSLFFNFKKMLERKGCGE